jgi:uncharacterized membrane protein YhaH (DUF805 family)
MGKYLKNTFLGAFNMTDRANRIEFWLFFVLFITGLVLCAVVDKSRGDEFMGPLAAIYFLLIIPLTSLSVRRLHDLGIGGWFLLLACIPFIYAGFLVLFLFPGTKGENDFGFPKEYK